MATALDYSEGRPSGAAVKKDGHAGVVRYAGTPGRGKNITKAEFQDLDRNGIGVALVYENKAGDALLGRAAGGAAAAAIVFDARNIGFPATRPLYFAVDQDITTQMPAVIEYFRGINNVIGVARTGAYGEADVIDALFAAGVISYGWQTAAWSKSRKAKKAHLFQRIGTAIVGGVGCDVNDILATDWGQHNTHTEDDMQLTDEVYQPDGTKMSYGDMMAEDWARLKNIEAWIPALQAQVSALSTALAASTKDPTITKEDIEAVLKAAVQDAIEVTGSVRISAAGDPA